jgi:hypothetical protein
MRMGTQNTVHCIGLINQILRMGTLDSAMSRFNKSDFENGYTVHSKLYRSNKTDYENGYTVHSTLYKLNKTDYEDGYSAQYTV